MRRGYIWLLIATLAGALLMTGCEDRSAVLQEPEVTEQAKVTEPGKKTEENVELIWYQVGSEQEDSGKVLEKVNEYLKSKLGVTLDIRYFGWSDCEKKAQALISSGEYYDLMFTSSWSVDYYKDIKKEAFLPLNDLLDLYGQEMYNKIDRKFWDGVSVNGVIYAVPNEKEIVSMPMWCFTKEYVDKYEIPYEGIHTLEDLEPWLKIIADNEPEVVPLYLTRDFNPPIYMDDIVLPLGIEYFCDPENLVVVNLFETEKMKDTLNTLRKYYTLGYINEDAATTSDNPEVKRFVTKGDGQPYADRIWSRNLGYEVVTSTILETEITSNSARGAMTSISRSCRHPDKAMQLLNLINTDEYLRNLLNYGIEGVHYTKVKADEQEIESCRDLAGVYSCKIHFLERASSYNVPYWVQGGLFNTYVSENEPLDKWYRFMELNKNAECAPSFGFDFNTEGLMDTISGIDSIVGQFSSPLYTGSVDPETMVPLLLKKLKDNGIDELKRAMQKQLDEWKK